VAALAIKKWLVAILATVAAFAAVTWICGALILSLVMRDAGSRWGVAGACGVAVAALVALWGHSFASANQAEGKVVADAYRSGQPTARTGMGSVHNDITGGTFHGTVIQARDLSGSVPGPLSEQPPGPSGLTRDG
jgi:hypothetical protein